MSDQEKPALDCDFWLHVCEAETEQRREFVNRNGARESLKGDNSY